MGRPHLKPTRAQEPVDAMKPFSAKIIRVRRISHSGDAWLDLQIDGEARIFRVTLLDAPAGIEAAIGDPVVLESKFILRWHHGRRKLVRWAHRMNYCVARMCGP